jgi:hypothetical protein
MTGVTMCESAETLAAVQARLTFSPSLFSSHRYNPSHALAYTAIALFAVTFFAQVAWLIKKRAHYVRLPFSNDGEGEIETDDFSSPFSSLQMIPFAVACLGEAVGYGFRRVSADHPTGRKAGLTWVRSLFPSSTGVNVDCLLPFPPLPPSQYILQELFIILCPALMAASYYMCFGRTSSRARSDISWTF